MISDKLFVISSHGVAAFISPQTGEIIETNKIPGSFFIAPVVVDGVIYLLNDSGDLIIYNWYWYVRNISHNWKTKCR